MTGLERTAPAAPVGEAEIRAALDGRGLPTAAYRSTAVFEWEQEHLLGGTWFCVGRASELGPEERSGVEAGTEGILLTRDHAGVPRAFHNTCRHRGHELVEPGGRARGSVVRCPYHAWAYGLDGRLVAAPHFGAVPGFDRAAHSLHPVRVAEWEGWTFVDLAGNAPELPDHVGDLAGEVAPYGIAGLAAAATCEYVVAANWKLVVENYHECYHCPTVHPELCRVSPPDSGANFRPAGAWAGGTMLLREGAVTMSLDGRSGGLPLPGLDEPRRRQVLYVGLFPNLLISAHPDYVLTHRLHPVDAGHTRIVCDWLFPREVAAASGFDPSSAVDFWDLTNRQDWRACESVQRGIASRRFVPGPLGPGEDAVREHISLVARAYLTGRPAGR